MCVCIYIIYTHTIFLSTYNFGLQSKSKSNIKKAHCNPLFLFSYFTWIISLTRLPKSFCWGKKMWLYTIFSSGFRLFSQTQRANLALVSNSI